MLNPPLNVRAVVFDAFGTLLQIGARRRPYRALQTAMAKYGRQPQPDDAVRMLTSNTSLSGFAVMCGVQIPKDELDALEGEVALEVRSVEAFDDAVPVLNQLKEMGFKLAICSNLAQPYGNPVRNLLPPVDAYGLSYEVGAVTHVCKELDCAIVGRTNSC